MTASYRLSPSEFAAKWIGVTTTERASAQAHFIDLCRMLEVPAPHDVDPDGEWYAFERGVGKASGGEGWADVWKRGHFGWEYKGKHRDLAAAYAQLLNYRESLENPPLLVVCDLDRFEVHTNFTNTAKQVYPFSLADLRDNPAEPLRILRAVMSDPEALRPQVTREEITQAAAGRFADIAKRLQERGHDPEEVAHFLNRVLFCFFAEDADLLPDKLLTRLVTGTRRDPEAFRRQLRRLFTLMSTAGDDRHFGTERVEWFNGGLFDSDAVLPLETGEIELVYEASALDWSQVEPSVLGTLFERGLDPEKRGQLGAHYTDRGKIDMVVGPVVMEPLEREFAAMRERVEALLDGRTPAPLTRDLRPRANRPPWEREAEAVYHAFLERLRGVRVLDPACGSGNFLYVALQRLKDLEHRTIQWGAETLRLTGGFPEIGPENVLGIELNPYAAELARVSIWIGEIQWMIGNGYSYRRDPILRPLDNIEQRDAILAHDADGRPVPAEWPAAEFIVGNPPFLGDKHMRRGLGDEYVDALRAAYRERVPGGADLVSYWHEKAREEIEFDRARRAGLLATNSIRVRSNRRVLDQIKQSGDIFLAWSDEPWVVEGAAVRVSIVGQDDGSETERRLDGRQVDVIHADLKGGDAAGFDLTTAILLPENTGASFIGDQKSGGFDISAEVARAMLTAPINVNGRPNSDVVRPWVNGSDIVRRNRDMFIIDFGVSRDEASAAQYELPYEYVREHVLPMRRTARRSHYRERWWLHGETRPGMRGALTACSRYLATPRVAKHRIFVWLPSATLADSRLTVIARDDDYTFGVLHSRMHELWSLGTGGWHGVGNDPQYTPTSTFETFPFPWPLNTPDEALTSGQAAHRDAIAEAARSLDAQREAWLNPEDLVVREPDVLPSLPERVLPRDEEAAKDLAKRTLTNLYNARPQWLVLAHAALDAAVLAAYGWASSPSEPPLDDEELLRRLLALNLQRAGGAST